jgi:FolB domain-containing protein
MGRSAGQDHIFINDLTIECVIGVNPEERKRKQKLKVDIDIVTDLTVPGVSDSLDDTIDYSTLAKKIIRRLEGTSWILIEKAAEEISKVCLEPAGSESVTVLVKKPGALGRVGNVAVEIQRGKQQ